MTRTRNYITSYICQPHTCHESTATATMVQFYDNIPEFMRDWIPKQKIFWVATAPLSGEGHVNLSPKGGHGTFHIIDEHTVWYEDLTGSGT